MLSSTAAYSINCIETSALIPYQACYPRGQHSVLFWQQRERKDSTATHLEEPEADAWWSVNVPPLRVQTPHIGSSQAASMQPLNCTVPSRPQACRSLTLSVSGDVKI